MTELLDTIQRSYPLTPPLSFFDLSGGVNNAVVGLHTGDGDFVLKSILAQSDRARLADEVKLLRWLARQALSFAVPTPARTHSGDILLMTPLGDKMLFSLLPGRWPIVTNPTEIEAVGAALGELHITLAHYPSTEHRSYSSYGALNQVHPRLPNPYDLTPAALGLPVSTAHEELFAWWRAELAALRAFVIDIYAALPQQMIHADFAPGNTLYAAGRITAILDFEFAGPDVRAIDVAAGLVFSMRLWENPQPLVNATAFCRGYGTRQRLTPAEIAAIPWLMRLRNAVSCIWWFGRELAAGNQAVKIERVTDMQQLVAWLGAHGQALLEILALHLQDDPTLSAATPPIHQEKEQHPQQK